ncbi:C-type lectin domain family 4 member G isoform X4 [Xenopus laevis]|uniref:C-type lectin domain family 4 member G isoform X3 n=1 Tax=Xenopus laevis TaxID=8355 RepID=A0A8J1MNU1_XENLA|nr:C-type lectin domain family 4 member G isoform X3 [Xenopus laevis]XP_041443083.1 C-type lectin domain family 4 member G isoform X4 [Xenopus laevis]
MMNKESRSGDPGSSCMWHGGDRTTLRRNQSTGQKDIPIHWHKMDRGNCQGHLDTDDDTYANMETIKSEMKQMEISEKSKEEELSPKFLKASEILRAQRRLLVVLVTLLILAFIFLISLASLVFTYYSAVSSEIRQLKTQESSLSSELSKLQSQVSDSSISNEISMLKIQGSSISDEINKLKDKDSTMSGEINQLKSQDSTMSGEINQLKSQDSSIYGEINKLKSQETCCGTCPSGWKKIGTTCYYVSTETATWENALNACKDLQALLLIPRDMTEMACVNRLAGRNSRHWIGLKRESSNTWRWLDGTQMTFSNWSSGEPNNDSGKENCVETMDGPWNDNNCDIKLHYICKRTLSC